MTWGKLIAELARQVPEKLFLRITQEALALAAFSQTDEIRSIGGIILGAVVEIKKKPPGEITRKICSLAQDPSNSVRKHMCGTLKILFNLSGEFQEKVIQEIIQLVGDECSEVLEEALKLFIEILPEIRNREIIVESIEEFFVKSQFDKLTDVKLRFVGRIMQSCSDVMSDQVKEKWLDWVVKMAGLGSVVEKRSLVISFGGILDCVKLSRKVLDLWVLLESENDPEINNSLILLLGFLSTFAEGMVQQTQQIVRKYIKNMENIMVIVPQLTVIASSLKMNDEILQVLLGFFSYFHKCREVLVILEQLISFANNFDCIFQLTSLVPQLISGSQTAPLPIKEKSLELLSIILYKQSGYSNKMNLAQDIIAKFANSPGCYHRALYIHFCLCVKELCSKHFFCKVFMPSLLKLAEDKVKLVRYMFAKNYASFRYQVPLENIDLAGTFRSILNNYLETEDKILVSFALLADEAMNNNNREMHYGAKSEHIENEKIEKETAEEIKEITEAENLKRVQNEENFRSCRKNTKKFPVHATVVLRQSSVKPIKKYHLSESDKYETALNRSSVRQPRKK